MKEKIELVIKENNLNDPVLSIDDSLTIKSASFEIESDRLCRKKKNV